MLENGDLSEQFFTEGHNFDKGSYVEYIEVEGMVSINKDNYNKMHHDK